ncbi:MAG: phage head closure protein [Gammaproteobacteria bacterium]|nr:phage head closure protein [Gammaproteobacteria bacterium]
MGSLNRRITIKDWQDEPNADAGINQTFTQPVDAWAKIEPVGAALMQGSMQLNDTITHRFYIRYRTDITADKRLFMGDVQYRIRRVSDLADARRFLVIEAEELGSYAS